MSGEKHRNNADEDQPCRGIQYDKGADGTENNLIAQAKTNFELGSIEFKANVKTKIPVNQYILNHAVTLKFESNGAALSLGWSCIIIHARRG